MNNVNHRRGSPVPPVTTSFTVDAHHTGPPEIFPSLAKLHGYELGLVPPCDPLHTVGRARCWPGGLTAEGREKWQKLGPVQREPDSLTDHANAPSQTRPDGWPLAKESIFPGPVPEPQGLVARH